MVPQGVEVVREEVEGVPQGVEEVPQEVEVVREEVVPERIPICILSELEEEPVFRWVEVVIYF